MPAQQKVAQRVRAGDVSLPEAATLLEAYEGELIRHMEQDDFASVKQNALQEIERFADDPNSVSLRRNVKAKLKEFAAQKRERWEDHQVAPWDDWSDRENDLNFIEEATRLIARAEVYLKALVRQRGPTMDRDLRIRLADACDQASRSHQLPLSTPSEDGDAVMPPEGDGKDRE
jgi:hypothetical protein